MTAAIEDRREAIAGESQRYRAEHFPDGHMPPKHDARQLLSEQPKEVPGGVGYGYYYDVPALLWTNSTIADYYAIAPASLGGNVSFLYLTSTCRAQLGTESLVAYENTSGPQFWIYDWSQAASNPWVVEFDLPSAHPQYLTTRPDEFAVMRQMVHVRNGTYYLGFSKGVYNWQNQTLLFNYSRGGWDYIYSTNYTTTTLNANLPSTNGEYNGSWGPIVETFPPYTNVNPVGFDLIRLFQDGNATPSWLTPSNSYVQDNAGGTTNWSLLTQAPNTSFTVCYGSNSVTGGVYNVGTLCVTATINNASFSLNPAAGSNSSSWTITPNSNRWDKTVVGLNPGNYTVTFKNVPGWVAPAPQALTIATNNVATVQANYLMMPVVQSVSQSGETMTAVWNVQSNSSYQAQAATNLSQINWTNYGNPITATNGTVTTTNSISTNPHWFYRLMLLQ